MATNHTLVGWQSGPNTCCTTTILYPRFTMLFLCSYNAIHLDTHLIPNFTYPSPSSHKLWGIVVVPTLQYLWTLLTHLIFWIIITLTPEFYLVSAIYEYAKARECVYEVGRGPWRSLLVDAAGRKNRVRNEE